MCVGGEWSAKRFINHRDHGVSATVVEETVSECYMDGYGAWVWSGMKETADKMWSSSQGLSGGQLHGGRYFLEGLCRVQQQKPSLAIDLVGHSAGSIAICKMFETAASANLSLKIRNLILMAPACTSELFYHDIVPHPHRYNQFLIFTTHHPFE